MFFIVLGYSNTTNVKVKPFIETIMQYVLKIQIQPMLRLNSSRPPYVTLASPIQIQPMLRLNFKT